jgi:hypothetical protein
MPTNCDSRRFNHRVEEGNLHRVSNCQAKEHGVGFERNIIILIIIVLIIDSKSLTYI